MPSTNRELICRLLCVSMVVFGIAGTAVLAEESDPHDEEAEESSEDESDPETDFFDSTIERMLGVGKGDLRKPQLYGYIRANVERVFSVPSVDGNGNSWSRDRSGPDG